LFSVFYTFIIIQPFRDTSVIVGTYLCIKKEIMLKQLLIFTLLFSITTVGCSQQEVKTTKPKKKGTKSISEYIKKDKYQDYKVATFAGGCFWCTEAAFERIEGVEDVISGYSGGKTERPTYKEVGAGSTGHAEAIIIYYDPEVVSFQTLLDVFFVAHDPTTLNRQGPDYGTAYRSAIYYHDDTQKELAEKTIKKIDDSGKLGKPIVTEVSHYTEFWVAEDYHQDYYELNPNQPYVKSVSRPKVEKVEKSFASILKEKYRK
jgi:peptide-methionine (S)-S-oxide reductase